jgi:hypothetical protein
MQPWPDDLAASDPAFIMQWCSGCFFNDFSITVHKERAADSRFASVSAPEPHRFFSRTEKSRAAAYASADFHYRLR